MIIDNAIDSTRLISINDAKLYKMPCIILIFS